MVIFPPNLLWKLWGVNHHSTWNDDDDEDATRYCSECGEEFDSEYNSNVCPYCGHVEEDDDFNDWDEL